MVIPIVPSKSKKIFLFSVVILIFLFLFLLFHKSENPILWNYSAHFLLFLFLYFGFLIVCLFSYFKIDKLGLKYCTFLLCIYILSFALVDFIIGSKYYYSSTRLKDHPVYHHTLLPGVYNLAVTGVSFLDRKYIIMHVNSLGLRSMREISLRKPQNHFRILLLGDSFTEGKEVETNETFAYLFEEYLKSSGKNVLKYEVLNSGVDS